MWKLKENDGELEKTVFSLLQLTESGVDGTMSSTGGPGFSTAGLSNGNSKLSEDELYNLKVQQLKHRRAILEGNSTGVLGASKNLNQLEVLESNRLKTMNKQAREREEMKKRAMASQNRVATAEEIAAAANGPKALAKFYKEKQKEAEKVANAYVVAGRSVPSPNRYNDESGVEVMPLMREERHHEAEKEAKKKKKKKDKDEGSHKKKKKNKDKKKDKSKDANKDQKEDSSDSDEDSPQKHNHSHLYDSTEDERKSNLSTEFQQLNLSSTGSTNHKSPYQSESSVVSRVAPASLNHIDADF